ncbi:rod shape-determining protein MreC [Moorella naiadis]|uniref:rod shape-determining protein MreC n=1 Tax=Moorella naiadis (nom. illeg.) TaxID=3093670 RepID=UPI003D9C9549
MSRRWRKLVAPLILVLAVAGLIAIMRWSALERSRLTFLEGSLRDALAPAERGITLVVNKGTGWLAAVKDYGHLQAENQALQQQVAELQAATVQMEEYRQENNRLRALLDYKTANQQAFTFTAAPVIGRNPNNWYHTITLGLGSSAGLKKDQVVVTSQGVVGRIIAVSPRTAEVLLILDREGAIGGMIQVTRTPGIVEGSPDYRGYLQMVHVPRDAQILPNQVVITSGLGGVFPRGLLLGTVIKTLPEPDGLMQRAIIAPAVDFDRLEDVLVITGVKGGINDAVPGVTGPGPGGAGPGGNPAAGH